MSLHRFHMIIFFSELYWKIYNPYTVKTEIISKVLISFVYENQI